MDPLTLITLSIGVFEGIMKSTPKTAEYAAYLDSVQAALTNMYAARSQADTLPNLEKLRTHPTW